LAVGGRVVMAAVVVGNVVGLCANVAAAAYSKEGGDLNGAAAEAYTANMTDLGNNFSNQANQKIEFQDISTSVQMFCEVAVLLVIIIAFTVVGIASARRVNSALGMNNEHGAAGRHLRRQIVGTSAFVFVTFLLRAVFSIMNAFSNALPNQDAACAVLDNNLCDPKCYNKWYILQQWLIFTPEFQLIVVLISSPLALLVALWGMTSERTLQHMRSGRGQMVSMPNSSLLAAK
jgi:hypothetical protein